MPPTTTNAPVVELVLLVPELATTLLAKVVWLGTPPPENPPEATHCNPVPVDDNTCPEEPRLPPTLIAGTVNAPASVNVKIF